MMQIHWLWFAGLLPYVVQQHYTKKGRIICIRALLWRLTVWQCQGKWSWKLEFPLIEHLPHEQ